MPCSVCQKTGHNAATCDSGRPLVCPKAPKGADIDTLVKLLLISRGYGGLAKVLDETTDPAEWADHLYDLAECTDVEDLLMCAAMAYRDGYQLGRLRALAADQREQDLLVDKPSSVYILQALAEMPMTS